MNTMREDALVQQRIKLIGWLFLLGGLLVVGRLFYLQIVRHGHYQTLADRSHFAKFEIPAARGEIYLLDHTAYAAVVLNETKYRLYGDPRFINDSHLTAEKLATITRQSATVYQEKLERQNTAYVVLEQQINHERAQAIRELSLKGVGLTAVPTRAYPEGSLAAQTLGFVNLEGKGTYGLEQALDSTLRGQSGALSGAVDVRGIPIATADNIEQQPVDGTGIVLTIDRNLQSTSERAVEAATKAYGGKSGDVIIMEIDSGAIKAMASWPRFQPAEYRKQKDLGRFVNPIVSGTYEPGSIAKVMTMALGLESGAVTPSTTYRDTSSRKIDNFTIRNSETRPTASRTMRDVIRLSLNTGSIFVLEELGGGQINQSGKTKLYDFFTGQLLLDKKTNLPQTGETIGKIDPPKGVSDVRYANMTFGQGMQLSMVRMASAYSALLNGGTHYKPRLVHATIDPNGKNTVQKPAVAKQGIVKLSTTQSLVSMMRAVVEEGAARAAARPGYVIGGKTGTAQKSDPRTGGYSKGRVVSSFVGFIGTDKPQYLVLVRVDEPQRTGIPSAAVSAFAQISKWLIPYFALPPKGQ
jgi:cell division protein FtsI (penicillin-binding protein 3)